MSPRVGLDVTTIMNTAIDIANTEGLESVTLAALAKKLNIKTPSLYNHIEGLTDLREKIAVYGLELLYQEMADAAIGKSGDVAIRGIGMAYISFARNHPGLYEATLKAPDTNVELQKAAGRIVELTSRIFKAYNLEDVSVIHAVRGFRSILHGFASLEQKGGFGMPVDVDKSLQLLIDTFLAGIETMRKG
ncbi:WHG domain-containing protein [Cytobacillus suaedae]|nr:WHG domain-containing protein [Cytobacillus suaedae]